MSEWISVDDEQPEIDETVLLFDGSIYIGLREFGDYYVQDISYSGLWNVTHWMPLPKPPIEE